MLFWAGCAHQVKGPTALLDAAATSTDARGANQTLNARTLALAGYHSYLLKNDAAKAQRLFDAAIAKNQAEPYALMGEWLMALRMVHPDKALASALEMCARNPHHPLAALAARYIADSSGVSTEADTLLAEQIPKLLKAGGLGESSYLLQTALVAIESHRGGPRESSLRLMGVPTQYALWGPLSGLGPLDFDAPLVQPPPENLIPRIVEVGDGHLSLANEPPVGNIYLFSTEVSCLDSNTGRYHLRVFGPGSYQAFVDGAMVLERRAFEGEVSLLQGRRLSLNRGTHRLTLKLLKEERGPNLLVSFAPESEGSSPLTFAAAPSQKFPEILTSQFSRSTSKNSDTIDLETALEPEAGKALATYFSAKNSLGRDGYAAKIFSNAFSQMTQTAAAHRLAGEVVESDLTLPPKVAKARSAREWELTFVRDRTDVRTLLALGNTAMDDGRFSDGIDIIRQIKAIDPSPGYPVFLLEARLELALGLDPQAEDSATAALKSFPGLCDALTLKYDLARRRDAASAADQWSLKMSGCPGADFRIAEHARMRGDISKAIELLRSRLAKVSDRSFYVDVLAQLLVAERKYSEAESALSRFLRVWPRHVPSLKQLGDVYDFEGLKSRALEARQRALQVDGNDLELRRRITREQTGKEVLQDQAIDGKKAIKVYESEHRNEEAMGAYVLDAAAVRAYPDGSMVDRIHVIQKALDQNGVSEIAEVTLPPHAKVLSLRTLKTDGTVLEPESFEEKETVSLPNVQVGDYVEYEYLEAHPARGPAVPGFTASNFYFKIPRLPNFRSTYTVIASKGMGMTVDAHQIEVQPVKQVGNEEIFTHEERRVAAFVPEPNGPPTGNEFLPFVSVGAGAQGNDAMVTALTDQFFNRGERTYEVDQFAHHAAGKKTGKARVEAIFSAVMNQVAGEDQGLGQSAATTLALGRGSRLWLLKASLDALQIPSRLVAVRTFPIDPAPYTFPNVALAPYVCIRVELPQIVWLDTFVRFGPFGGLPEQALGQREAWLLPEPGKPLAHTQTPPKSSAPNKRVSVIAELNGEGKLTGSGEETYLGFEAAQLSNALETLSLEQRTQALQSALSHYFGGAELSEVHADLKQSIGAPLTVRYHFAVPQFARRHADQWILGALTFPHLLGKRLIQTGSRQTDLFIPGSENSRTTVELKLPAGEQFSPVESLKSQSAFGRFERHERFTAGRIKIEETFQLAMGRIAPVDYEAFSGFAGEVDLIQSRDLTVQTQR